MSAGNTSEGKNVGFLKSTTAANKYIQRPQYGMDMEAIEVYNPSPLIPNIRLLHLPSIAKLGLHEPLTLNIRPRTLNPKHKTQNA